jgi:hypothetical protein
MKKYLKVVCVSLLVGLTMGKDVWASSKGLTGEQAMEILKQLKGSIAFLTRTIGTDENISRQNAARKNLEVASSDPDGRSILKKAFEDRETESKAYKFTTKKADDLWWSNFYTIKRTYLGK